MPPKLKKSPKPKKPPKSKPPKSEPSKSKRSQPKPPKSKPSKSKPSRPKPLRPRKTIERAVFLNIPYDHQFEKLCLAYICAIASFGLVPRATLELDGPRRLDRIIELMRSCPFSVHDLSRVQRFPPTRLPRFNMPFELGLTVAWQEFRKKGHLWYVFETEQLRSDSTLSDLKGTDVYVHCGKVEGVLTGISNAFIREKRQATFAQMLQVYRLTRRALPSILKKSGSQSIFNARPFKDVCLSAAEIASMLIP